MVYKVKTGFKEKGTGTGRPVKGPNMVIRQGGNNGGKKRWPQGMITGWGNIFYFLGTSLTLFCPLCFPLWQQRTWLSVAWEGLAGGEPWPALLAAQERRLQASSGPCAVSPDGPPSEQLPTLPSPLPSCPMPRLKPHACIFVHLLVFTLSSISDFWKVALVRKKAIYFHTANKVT